MTEVLFAKSLRETVIKVLGEDKEEVNWMIERFLRELCTGDTGRDRNDKTKGRIRRLLNEIMNDSSEKSVGTS